LYSSHDPREIPAYGVPEASHYLSIPLATLRSWVVGRYYQTTKGKARFKPVILVPEWKASPQLTFINLVEAHVLDGIRRQHKVPLPKVRNALEYLRTRFHSKHPLADQEFETDGLDLFVEKYGQLINISKDGQLAMKAVMQAYLKRIDRDSYGYALRLYPFVKLVRDTAEPKFIVIDPNISFGKPVLVGTGIPTSVIAGRYKTGESIDDLADDYGRNRLEIEEAIRCELQAA
jgi:uncharacterized protein (DUF433 family)